MPVPQRSESIPPAPAILDFFDLGPLDFGDGPALHTNQVVVVGPLHLHLEPGDSVVRDDPLNEPAPLEHIQRPEHGRFSDAALFQGLVNILDGEMSLGGKEGVEDLISGTGMTEGPVFQVLLKNTTDALSVSFAVCRRGREKSQLGRHIIDIQYQ
jgi:hypothetical protein